MKTGAAMGRRTVGTGISAALSSSHRLMFPAAAAVALGTVLWRVLTDSPAPAVSPLGPLWHGHELVFGMGGAAFAAYTLTAASSWSHRAPAHGARVGVLFALWLVARLSAIGWPGLPVVLAAAFPAWLAVLLAVEACAGRAAKGAMQAGMALALTCADLAMLTDRITLEPAILLFALIVSAVGGRMVRAFTENRRAIEGVGSPLPIAKTESLGGPAAIAAAILLDLAGQPAPSAVALLAAAAIEARRLWLWQGAQVRRDPLIAMLHLGYLWLPVGLGLTGLSRLDIGVAETDALHALTAGAMACLIQAIAARATALRGGPSLKAGRGDILAFACLWGAAVVRVALPGATTAAGLLWLAGWALFLAMHLAALGHAPPRPAFSGPRA